MSRLSEILSSGEFAVTCELNPPKGTGLGPLFDRAESLRDAVTAFNLTDSAGSNMSMAPIGAARLLAERGIETILQVTCRDRNRIALQSELLAASALGLPNVLCMSGDPAWGRRPCGCQGRFRHRRGGPAAGCAGDAGRQGHGRQRPGRAD